MLHGPSFIVRSYVHPDLSVQTNAAAPLVVFARTPTGAPRAASYALPQPDPEHPTVISVDALVVPGGALGRQQAVAAESAGYRLEDILDPVMALNRQNLRSLDFDLDAMSTPPP